MSKNRACTWTNGFLYCPVLPESRPRPIQSIINQSVSQSVTAAVTCQPVRRPSLPDTLIYTISGIIPCSAQLCQFLLLKKAALFAQSHPPRPDAEVAAEEVPFPSRSPQCPVAPSPSTLRPSPAYLGTLPTLPPQVPASPGPLRYLHDATPVRYHAIQRAKGYRHSGWPQPTPRLRLSSHPPHPPLQADSLRPPGSRYIPKPHPSYSRLE